MSLNSYWENEYHRIDRAHVKTEYRFFYSFMLNKLKENLKTHLHGVVEQSYLEGLSNDYELNDLEETYKFFEADVFQGYVIRANLFNITFEAFIKFSQNMLLTAEYANGTRVEFNNNREHTNPLIKTLMRIKV